MIRNLSVCASTRMFCIMGIKMNGTIDRQDRRVAIIDNAIDPLVYNPVRHWSVYLDVPWQAFRAPEGKFPDWDNGFSHVIISGSEASILDRDRWVEKEIKLVEEAVRRGLSILGSCYGHQVLVIALAGARHVRECVQPEIGWIPIEIKENSQLLGKRRFASVFSSHFDEVFDLGREFRILAATEMCAIQAFQWKENPVWGLQFHPEMNKNEASRYLRRSFEKGGRNRIHYKEGLRSLPQDSGLIRPIIRRFVGYPED